MSEEDKSSLESLLGPGSKTIDTCTLIANYSGRRWEVKYDEGETVRWLKTSHELSQPNLEALKSAESISDLLAIAEGLKAQEENPALVALIAKAKAITDDSIDQVLTPRTPSFLYFSHYDRMDGKVSVEQILQRRTKNELTPADKVFFSFLETAGTTIEELKDINRYESLKARVEAASISITDQMFEYWSQNDRLSVEFTLESAKPGDQAPFNSGNIMHARIWNDLHRMSLPLSERSAGFIWFFSFLVHFSQVVKQYPNLIILLDEPGLTLHAKAQADLLKFLNEKIRPSHQIIYSTHSPFMVPANELEAVRTVEDVVIPQGNKFRVDGTKVGDKVLSTDRDTLFPLRGALGYEITQTLFIGENTLLVEGPSDILYLTAFSNELKRRDRRGLDPRWTICPSGGIDKVNAFVSLFHGNKLNLAIFTDTTPSQKNKIENLKKSRILEESRIFSAGDFSGQDEADIEDMIGSDLYLTVVNAHYKSGGHKSVTKKAMSDSGEKSVRVVKRIEAALRSLPDIPGLDHYAPAFFLIQNPALIQNARRRGMH